MFAIFIGVISDTHIPTRAPGLPEQVQETFQGVDLILHAGDLVQPEVLYQLEDLAEVQAVAGNMDPPFLQQTLGTVKSFHFKGFRIGLLHGQGDRKKTERLALRTFKGFDCIVYGHSHAPCNRWEKGTLLFNPGSPTDKRFEARYSLGLLRLYEEIKGEIIYFD